ncbi:MAG TPA: trypsin-like peptidase domain-containing protein [Thermoanaerobaculia bacterium]|nr:trypsin-like peptidase domain-containing protein [Thermoanaerobaculia bacterium]
MLVHLSGDLRGTSLRLQGDRLAIGTAEGAPIRLRAHEESVGREHAELVREGSTWRLEVEPGRSVWVDGERVESRRLEHGDVLEIGPEGPVLRFRLDEPGSEAWKSPREAFEDCLDGARRASGSPLGRVAAFLRGIPRELATQTSRGFRLLLAVLLVALVGGLAWLGLQSRQLERRLESESARFRALSELVESSRISAPVAADLDRLRRELEGQVSATAERLESLEARSDAPTRVLALSSGSIAFLQGSFGFVDAESGRPYRIGGRDESGQPVVTTEGDGPLLERLYTGTAWVASSDGVLVTNRHVALPWENDEAARAAAQFGLEPGRLRLLAYLPGIEEPFEVTAVAASDAVDLALLRCNCAGVMVPALGLRDDPPHQGEEVLVLGYPAGIPALLARSDPTLARELMEQKPPADFWTVARRLSEAKQIAPLATRGIVGQVTAAAIVYDAQTTFGGSGGPVLDFDGRVIAVNSAILSGFGGSNLGVPAAAVRKLLEEAEKPEPKPSEAEGERPKG